jgi:hypothetical protein
MSQAMPRMKEIGLSFGDRNLLAERIASIYATEPEFWNTVPNELSLSLTSRARARALSLSLSRRVCVCWYFASFHA